MPLVAMYLYRSLDGALRKEAGKVLKSALKTRALQLRNVARSLIGKRGAGSAPGQPFSSFTGRARASLKIKVGQTAASTFVGFTPVRRLVTRSRKGKRVWATGKTGYANLLEHGTRRMAARPVLQPALEQVKTGSPFRGLINA